MKVFITFINGWLVGLYTNLEKYSIYKNHAGLHLYDPFHDEMFFL